MSVERTPGNNQKNKKGGEASPGLKCVRCDSMKELLLKSLNFGGKVIVEKYVTHITDNFQILLEKGLLTETYQDPWGNPDSGRIRKELKINNVTPFLSKYKTKWGYVIPIDEVDDKIIIPVKRQAYGESVNIDVILPKDILKYGLVRYIVAESGGGMTNTGHATIWAGAHLEPLKAWKIIRKGPRACGTHVFFKIYEGWEVYKIETDYWNKRTTPFKVVIYKINVIKKGLEEEVIYDGDGFTDVPKHFKKVVALARKKATDYHCREGYYYRT